VRSDALERIPPVGHESREIRPEIGIDEEKRRHDDDRQTHHPPCRLHRQQGAEAGYDVVELGVIPAGLHDAHVVHGHVQPDGGGEEGHHPVVPMQSAVGFSADAGREQNVGQEERV
jgi:hypothetical protein